MPSKILIIDDEKNILYSLKKILCKHSYEVDTFTSPTAGLESFRNSSYSAVLIDYKMPEMDGLQLLQQILNEEKDIPVIMMTAYGTTETTIEAISAGATDYLTKPFESDELIDMLKRVVKQSDNSAVQLNLSSSDAQSGTLIGKSKGMQDVYKQIGQFAKNDINVLISGESGTGKELVAKTIWKFSKRENERFIAVNCSAIPSELLESEFFGYEKGAFTGAAGAKPGKFELANNGTLFLDEIGDMPVSLQAKLLRVLQDGKIERLGGTVSIKTNVRVISATNKNLEKLIQNGEFREDLFYRLNVAHINIPPLRERPEDIKPLVEYFVNSFNALHEKDVSSISKTAMRKLEEHNFNGNVRELENIINRAVAVSSGNLIEEGDILIRSDENGQTTDDFKKLVYKNSYEIFQRILSLNESERPYIMRVIEETLIKMTLEHFNYNQVHSAAFLGITRNTLRKRMEWYSLL